jgi:hypothetical protein
MFFVIVSTSAKASAQPFHKFSPEKFPMSGCRYREKSQEQKLIFFRASLEGPIEKSTAPLWGHRV